MRTRRFFSTLSWIACAAALVACQPRANHDALRQGYQSLDQKAYDQALASADRYLAERPGGSGAAEATYLRGRAIEQRVKADNAAAAADLREARWIYQQALDLNPTPELEGYIRTSIGNVYYWLDEYASAEQQWTAAVGLLRHADLQAWVLYRIGLSQQRQGKWAAADSTFVSVQQRFPGTEPAARALSHHGAREFNVQVAAFQSRSAADALAVKLRSQGFPSRRFDQPKRNLHLVMVGPMANYADARAMRMRLATQHPDAMILP